MAGCRTSIICALVTPATRALIVIDPNNPTGASYPTATRRALPDVADQHGLAIVADEVYGDLGYDGPVASIGSLDPDAPIISFSSLSKAYLAPGWRAGWLSVGRSPRLNDVVKAVAKLADGRLCSNLPMQYAIAAALTGDRSHQVSFRAALRERAAVTHECLNAIPGITSVAATAGFYAMPRVALPPGKTDEDYVLAAARHRNPLRLWIRLRDGSRGWLQAERVARGAGRAARHLRIHGRVHKGISRAVTGSRRHP